MSETESIDYQIVDLLARDGRMSYTDIGRATGLSTSAAQQRVRRLEQRGFIRGYKAIVNPSAMGRTLTVFISVHTQNGGADDKLPSVLASLPDITSCFLVAGDASYVCMAEVSSMEDLDALLTSIRRVGNVSTSTTVALKTLFRGRPLSQVGAG